ncbi:non-ribosomal peptide synthetase [Streptomyces reniochalinae]|uniref:Amino acid adenylation domain-containing protein n=1 Tax=Streptomyces reniochalinae TaxID=2250578 RepID=A0A367F1B4_9ACTN|nr:non-ribosomal peptide synthetase [Streptomyces reniochalinae]RCG24166.1 amino acid adenylation domain-containing protein [Streptomyces reniochalinae]
MPTSEPRPTNPFPLVRSPAAEAPLSAGQERLWWLHQSNASHEYHITGGWRFPDGVDRAALSTAVAGLVRRHAILRTRFVLRPDGTTAQEVADELDTPVTWAGKDWRAAVDRAVLEPFDLARPPLLRVVVAEPDGGPAVWTAMHHIVTDRWSMDVFARDLLALYEAALAGREPQLPQLAVQYGDYARWQRRLMESGELTTRLERGTQALRGSERLELPLDRPRSAAHDAAGGTVVVELSQEATAAMTAMAWRARATPAVVMTAALVAALGAFSGQDDVVIGAVISDRPHPDLQDLVGFFVNTVALRVDLSGAPTFRDVVIRTRDAWMAADANQDVPFEQLGTGHDAGRNPVFDVVMNHAGDRVSLAESENAPTWWYPELPVTARFDLSLTTQVVDGRLRATFVYRSALFDQEPIAALAAGYLRLLEQGVTNPRTPLHEMTLVDEGERKLLHGGNDTTPAPDATIVERVQAQAATHPSAPAVAGATGVLSYGELNARANRLARHLRTLGAGPERVVAVCLDTTVERFVVLLAVAKAGAAYLPLDPDHPTGRLRHLLADADAVLAVVSPALRDRLPQGAAPTLVWGGAGEPDLSGYGSGNLPPAAGPDNLAYLISTSGSTGTPKAVAVPHRALSRLTAGAPGYLDIGPGAVFLQCGPLTFDVAVLEWTPLAHGGCVVVTDTGTLLDGLERVVREHGVTTLKLVSPQLDLLVERGIGTFAGLRQLVVGGDVVNPKSFAAAREGLPGCRVTASYGPTECTVLATVFHAGSWAGRVPLGYAIPHTRVYVLDRNLRPAAVGMRGEIYLAGDGLARGYHGRPGATAEKFVPDPFGPPGSRMYRTGDLGRYLPGGAVDFLGRGDTQVKVRGFRIETSEIEHALLREPGTTSCVVLRTELDTGPALVAYVVSTEPVDVAALRGRLGATLPAYMIPDHVVEVERIPFTAHNKVDRAALPPVAAAEPEAAPTTGLEARVAEAWSEVLGRTVPATADFFAQGGHSLLVPRATAAIRRLLGREVPLRLMMAHRTPADYAAAVLRESAPQDGPAYREDRLGRLEWHGRRFTGSRRLDLFCPAGETEAVERTLIVLDGSEFVDVMRLPAILERLALQGRIPVTAALFVSPTEWAVRNRELLDPAFVDLLADELVPYLRERLGGRWRGERATAVGASLGAVTAVRAALRRPESFDTAVGLSGPLTDHVLAPAAAAHPSPARFFLSASHEEAETILEGGIDQLDATRRTGAALASLGHTVECAYGDGGHTYAAWEAMLPRALSWALGAGAES